MSAADPRAWRPRGGRVADLARRLDAMLSAPVVVFGSRPPRANDLDLLVRPGDLDEVRAAVVAAGGVGGPSSWIVLGDDGPVAVDLVDVTSWGLPDDAIATCWHEASPLPGHVRLHAPSPAHAVLIAARRLAWTGRSPAAGSFRDASAWAGAREQAGTWGVARALDLLEQAHRGRPPDRVARTAAVAAELRQRGRGRLRGWAGALRWVGPRPRRGVVVALSGLDGCGKTTQSRVLVEVIEMMGRRPERHWTRLSRNPLVSRVGRLGRRALAGRSAPVASVTSHAEGRTRTTDSFMRALEGRSQLSTTQRALRQMWATLLVLANIGTLLRRGLRARWTGRVAVFDRYALDSEVHLRARYGVEDPRDWRLRLLHRLVPTPDVAILLRITADESRRRDPDEWTYEQLERLQRLYDTCAVEHGVVVVDGQRAPHAVARDVVVLVLGAHAGA